MEVPRSHESLPERVSALSAEAEPDSITNFNEEMQNICSSNAFGTTSTASG